MDTKVEARLTIKDRAYANAIARGLAERGRTVKKVYVHAKDYESVVLDVDGHLKAFVFNDTYTGSDTGNNGNPILDFMDTLASHGLQPKKLDSVYVVSDNFRIPADQMIKSIDGSIK